MDLAGEALEAHVLQRLHGAEALRDAPQGEDGGRSRRHGRLPSSCSPTSAWMSPARHSRLTSCSACTAPKRFDTPCRRRTGSGTDVKRYFLAGYIAARTLFGTSVDAGAW